VVTKKQFDSFSTRVPISTLKEESTVMHFKQHHGEATRRLYSCFSIKVPTPTLKEDTSAMHFKQHQTEATKRS
jgi:hypothetical protein